MEWQQGDNPGWFGLFYRQHIDNALLTALVGEREREWGCRSVGTIADGGRPRL